MKKRKSVFVETLTIADLRAKAARLARLAGFSPRKAFSLLKSGELDGTILESELKGLLFLANGRRLT